MWVKPEEVVSLCKAIVEIFRDYGLRLNRQRARLMWLIDEWGLEKFRNEVEKHWGKTFKTAAPKDEIDWEKRDHIGIYPQKQPGLNYAGLNIPVGRLSADDMFELGRLAEVYGSGEIRFTVEQNAIIPNISDSVLNTFLKEPLLHKFGVNPGLLMRAVVDWWRCDRVVVWLSFLLKSLKLYLPVLFSYQCTGVNFGQMKQKQTH